MSLHSEPVGPIPEQTVRVARAAFPKPNIYMRMRDHLGVIYQDHSFASLFPNVGQPALAPWRLALVTIMQFAEGLTDRQAADAVRARIDWKYALGLELSDPGFNFSVLCEFRERLLAGELQTQLLEAMLEHFKQLGLLKPPKRQRTDSTHVLAAIRTLNRLEVVGETLRNALNEVAELAPEWLRTWVEPDWFVRYSRRVDDYRLPKQLQERKSLAEQIGADGSQLLDSIDAAQAPGELRELPAVQTLRLVWSQQYVMEEERLRWREDNELPPATELIQSPYDLDAHYSSKRGTKWVGFKTHLSEICDEDQAHLITHVETTSATTPDGAVTERVHRGLKCKGLLPAEHLVDAGYIDAEQLVRSKQEYGVVLFGPVLGDTTPQGRASAGFDVSSFNIDWAGEVAECPGGRSSHYWRAGEDGYGNKVIHIEWAARDCRGCALRQKCTSAVAHGRKLKVRLQAEHQALQAARQRQQSEEFKREYRLRSGAEAMISQGVRGGFAMRQSRYRGIAKRELQDVASAAAMNLVRMDEWLQSRERPRVTRRPSAFARLTA